MRLPALLALVVLVQLAEAGPTVEIRAQTQLSLGKVKKRDGGMVEVTGHLNDKLTGTGIAGASVSVSIGNFSNTGTTGEDGSFAIELPGDDGPQEVRLEYQGGRSLEKAVPLTVTTDPAKQQLELEIAMIGPDPAGAKLKINAKGDDGGAFVPVKLEIGTVDSQKLRSLRTVDSGTEFVLARKDVGGAGQYRLRATFVGDDMRAGAIATSTVMLDSNTTTSMNLSTTKLAFEDELVITGKVLDDDGAPVEHAAVTLVSGDRRLAQAATTDRGTYRFEVEGEIIGQGQFGIQVQSDPGKPFIRSSRSNPELVRVAAPAPVPVSYTIAAFLATAIAAGGFFAARNKPWRRLRRPAPPAEVPSQEGEIEQLQGGLVVAKPGVVATLRRPHDDGFSGVVRDTVRGRPVVDAVVILVLGEQERSIRTQADGSFTIDKLPVGEWRAEVAAPGYVTERFAVTIPHRGELRGVRIDLVPVRERVFQLYRRAAEPVLPETRLWGIWSPRQIVDHVRSKRPSPALADLTDFVEEIYFSPRLAAETVLSQASEQVDRAIHERAARR
ncbi:MAG TPA: carboxypeptidase regulatory-like domain-containing protein [Kofleriaceae bacterium]|nr:carboxypeptidase regulatory-like domain-containing protein [Kofleriaceae bacterium]